MEIDASITKAQLAVFGRNYGRANIDPFCGYGAQELIYKTFIGDFDIPSRLYVGKHYFELNTKKDAALADFDSLFGNGENMPCL
jgi:hypothetical protein